MSFRTLSQLFKCTTAFYVPQNLAKAMLDFRQASHGASVSAFIKGVRIRATHLGYHKGVNGLAKGFVTAKQHKFDSGDYGVVTVEEYFRRSRF
jgi:hypothetical protein